MLKGATEEIRCAASHVIFRLAARGDIVEARGPAECPAFKKCIHRKRQLKNSRKIYLIYYIYILSVYIIHIMAMGYLFIAYVCMIMAVQHCLQFCTSFQSQMKKMPDWLSRSRRNLFYGLLVVAQLSRFPVRFPCVLLSHCLHWCP